MVNCRKPKKIGIVGYYGARNLGDETVVAILAKRIRACYPNAEVVGFSLNPQETQWRHGFKAFPIRLEDDVSLSPKALSSTPAVNGETSPVTGLKNALKKCPRLFAPLKAIKHCCCESLRELAFLRRSFQRLQGFDLLVVPGSGPLTDWWGGPWTHPYSLLSWTCLARMTRTKVIALSIGSERLNTWLGKTFCKWALSMAHYRSFRDRYSRDTMESLGLKGANPVFPDQGFGLLDILGVDPPDAATQRRERNAGLTVGLCPVGKGCCVRPGAENASYETYKNNLTAFALWLIQRGHRIAFCDTHQFFDRQLVQQIIDTIKTECPREDVSSRIIQEPIITTEDLVARILTCDIVVASRFHGVVLPFVLQKPVLGIAYERKIGDLMFELGQADFHLPLDRADVTELIRLFRKLEQDRHAIARHLGTFVAEYRASLTAQYESLFGPFAPDLDRCVGGNDRRCAHQ
jgi:polysaccharide pyruvyl transferase WcaK-like protein